MKAIVIPKQNQSNSFEARAEKKDGSWLIGGDYPDYKNNHYIIISSDIEYSLRNGRMVRV